MLFRAVLIDALHPTLENRIVVLDRVAVDYRGVPIFGIAHVFIRRVLDRPVPGELLPDADVMPGLIGHEMAFLGDILAHDWRNVGNACAVHMEAAGGTAALHKRKDGVLVSRAARNLARTPAATARRAL